MTAMNGIQLLLTTTKTFDYQYVITPSPFQLSKYLTHKYLYCYVIHDEV